MLENYFPILLFILVGIAIGVLPIVLGWLIAPNRPDAEKLSPTNAASKPSKTPV